MEEPLYIIYGEMTLFMAPIDAEDLGSPGEDERWELMYPKAPDDLSGVDAAA